MCTFAQRGFPFDDNTKCTPCGVGYHPECFSAGAPFTTRRKNKEGLSLPVTLRDWANFICEKCTVRSVLN